MKNKLAAHIISRPAALLILIYLLTGCRGPDYNSIEKTALKTLDAIKEHKKKEIINHFSNLHSIARDVVKDVKMIGYFNALYSSGRAGQGQSGDPEIEFMLDLHYVTHYKNFYDILFIDHQGFVFHSLRKESDYNTWVLSKDNSTVLSRILKKAETDSFSGFDYYVPSNEPAAFHAVPVKTIQSLKGWIVFQHSVNCLNDILTDRQALGRSGEVYMVNHEGLMLSESRFVMDSTILKKRINTESVKAAFAGETGNRLIKDYRGVPVYSSFERFEFLGASWVIIAEIDQAEILTKFYRKYAGRLGKECLGHLAELLHPGTTGPEIYGPVTRVDMNEFALAGPGKYLRTSGVASCTAIAVSYPGRFSCLAHLVPTDNSYFDSLIGQLFAGKDGSLIDKFMDKLQYFEVYPSEYNQLEITIVATHQKSFLKIVDKLIEKKIYLSQIKIMYNPQASYANVTVNPADGVVGVEWLETYDKESVYENSLSVSDLSDIVKEISR